MYFDPLAALHTPLVPVLRHLLATAPLPRDGLVLDLACGPGLKTPLLAEACGRGVRLIGIDNDRAAVHHARRPTTDDHRPPTTRERRTTNDERRTTNDKETAIYNLQSTIYNLQSVNATDHGPRTTDHWLVGDALALPLRGGCCAAAFCIAALGLFADRRAALRELRRVLRPRGLAMLVVGTQVWAPVIGWCGELAMRVEEAYARALADGAPPLPASPDVSDELAGLLVEAGFGAPLVRAFLLDITTTDDRRPTTDDRRPTTDDRRPTTDDRQGDKETGRQGVGRRAQTDELSEAYPLLPSAYPLLPSASHLAPSAHPLAAELPLLPWLALRPLLAGRLTAAQFARCDQLADEAEIELCSLVLAAEALVP